jgi:hypothetical protein
MRRLKSLLREWEREEKAYQKEHPFPSTAPSLTKHAEERIMLRGLSSEAVLLAAKIGTPVNQIDDGLRLRILPRDMARFMDSLLQSFRNPSLLAMSSIQRQWQLLKEALEITVVVSENRQKVITVWGRDSEDVDTVG